MSQRIKGLSNVWKKNLECCVNRLQFYIENNKNKKKGMILRFDREFLNLDYNY